MVAKLMYSRVGAQCAMPTHARVAPRKLFDYCGAQPAPSSRGARRSLASRTMLQTATPPRRFLDRPSRPLRGASGRGARVPSYARDADLWRRGPRQPASRRPAPARSPPRPHACARAASSPCRPRRSTAWRPTQPRMRPSRRSTPPRTGRRSTRSSPMFSTSRRRASTPSSARRPNGSPTRSGPDRSLWSCQSRRPAGSACSRAPVSTPWRCARRRMKRPAR